MRKTTSIIRFHPRNGGCCLDNNCVLHDVVRFGGKKVIIMMLHWQYSNSQQICSKFISINFITYHC